MLRKPIVRICVFIFITFYLFCYLFNITFTRSGLDDLMDGNAYIIFVVGPAAGDVSADYEYAKYFNAAADTGKAASGVLVKSPSPQAKFLGAATYLAIKYLLSSNYKISFDTSLFLILKRVNK